MLGSISPVGEASRGQRWPITVTAYLVASAVSGLAIGAVLGGLGALIGTASWGRWSLVVLGVAAIVGAAIDGGRTPVRLPSWRRQVDERWLTTYRGWVYGAGYGLQLGVGVATIISSALTHAALLAALLTGSVAHGMSIGLTFGAVRAVPLLLTAAVRTPDRVRRLHRWLDGATRPVVRTGIGSQLVVGVLAITVGIVAVPA